MTWPVQAAAPGVFQIFEGRWAGTLEDQDYVADRRVQLPVTLTVSSRGAQSRWLFASDDFGHTVQRDETHRSSGGRYTVTTKMGQRRRTAL
ncbi:hypothetical protein MF271_17545 (plasmid) [Deinococcus sp. KNUC1210]|uniref:hypothetical protein n=1 Tax=Deinococcus sp. KNUC1210 TaxID=2917691 RepID=UPI001EEF8559|nr:hypothetical protein [Deinococcus sp. KNUC1210]ULH16983.1 hypothetical protein MF271_17545 [Deinococcus sp. KNUC1210]